MAPLPKAESSTVRAIYAAYEAQAKSWDSWGISVGEAGTECDRALWFGFRWVSAHEVHSGRQLRLFATGNFEEDRLVADLESIGVDVYGQQDKIRLASGFVRGKCDGKAMGVPEAPKTEHLLEFKSSNEKGIKELQKHGCQKAKPLHYAQCQLGMQAFGLTRCLYLASCKNTDTLYAERIEYDVEFCLRLLARCERIVFSDEPPSRISEDPEFFGCMFCKHRGVCHEGVQPRVNCRTCLHVQPEHGGDCHMSCARWNKPLSIDEQRDGCPAHLYLPGLINGEQIDADEVAETVTYRLATGEIWVDGVHNERKLA
ncbi:oxidoreductase [Brucella tritici]|uniref:oxidoreductase n=1 Tax=Brucella tritici TaxID=94626 RepID=UPI003D6D66A7